MVLAINPIHDIVCRSLSIVRLKKLITAKGLPMSLLEKRKWEHTQDAIRAFLTIHCGVSEDDAEDYEIYLFTDKNHQKIAGRLTADAMDVVEHLLVKLKEKTRYLKALNKCVSHL